MTKQLNLLHHTFIDYSVKWNNGTEKTIVKEATSYTMNSVRIMDELDLDTEPTSIGPCNQ